VSQQPALDTLSELHAPVRVARSSQPKSRFFSSDNALRASWSTWGRKRGYLNSRRGCTWRTYSVSQRGSQTRPARGHQPRHTRLPWAVRRSSRARLGQRRTGCAAAFLQVGSRDRPSRGRARMKWARQDQCRGCYQDSRRRQAMPPESARHTPVLSDARPSRLAGPSKTPWIVDSLL
jgi:hypothetical protein